VTLARCATCSTGAPTPTHATWQARDATGKTASEIFEARDAVSADLRAEFFGFLDEQGESDEHAESDDEFHDTVEDPLEDPCDTGQDVKGWKY
jgi:hypothetical protein